MNVKLSIETSRYLLIATLSTTLKNGRPHDRTYEEPRNGEKKNHAEVKALLLGCRQLNQQMDFTLELELSSAYMQISARSLNRWQQDGWKNSKGKEIMYQEEWKEIFELIKKYKTEISSGKEQTDV
ncbi:MAG: hypothetical protein HFI34_06925 [Lachnospiraceae bacterium]|nr:hypothetical protein [Lachnospiraceae bacterium]